MYWTIFVRRNTYDIIAVWVLHIELITDNAATDFLVIIDCAFVTGWHNQQIKTRKTFQFR